jgi:uncharacterized protein YndB with AHSA1/START domain
MKNKVANTDTFKLDLPSDNEFCISREFNAPRELIFDCWSKPEHVRRWWHAYGGLTTCDIDFRVGGTWRYTFPSEHGEIGFNGVYQEISRPERIVHTMIFEPMPGDPAIITVTLEDIGGRTRVTEMTSVASKEIRDAIIATGMESGARLSYDQLETLLGALQQTVEA